MLHENNYLAWFGWLVFCLVGGLLAQTYLLPYWLGAGALLIGWQFWSPRQSSQLTIKNQSVFWLFGLIFLGLVINVLISQSWMVTLAESVVWVFMLLVGWAAMNRPPSSENQLLIWLGSLVLIFVTGVISLSTWFFPELRFLPDMNFLYATFGHNHWSVWLIISLPWVGLADKVWPSKIWKVLLGIWLIWLASTFGRWAVGVALIELIWLWLWLRPDKAWRNWLKIYFVIGLGMLISLLIWSNWLAHPEKCPAIFQALPQLCKPIHLEQRPEYWRQAIEGIKTAPILGHGLGTFNQISLLERRTPSSYSGYSHNDYLQWVVEAGWLGWLISLIFWWTWWATRPSDILGTGKLLLQSHDWFQRVVWLSAGAILINSLVDFDLHFVVVRVLLVVYLGWLFAWKNSHRKPPNLTLIFTKIQAGFLIILLSSCVLWAGYFGLNNYLWEHEKKELVWQQPYYFPAHSLWLMSGYLAAKPEQQVKVFDYWLGQPDSLEVLLVKYEKNISPAQKIMALENLYKLNPWSRVNFDLVALYLQANNLRAAQATFFDSDNFIDQQAAAGVELSLINDELRWRMARQAAELAGLAISQGDLGMGLENLKLAHKYEAWALGEERAEYGAKLHNWVLTHPLPTLAEAQFLDQIFSFTSQVDPAKLGFNQTYLARAALLRLHDLLSQGQCQVNECADLGLYVKNVTESATWVEENLAQLRLQFPREAQLQPK